MVRDERLSEAVAKAVERTPTSIRALAREAGVPHVSLLQVRDGDLGASPELAKAVAEALEGWSGELSELAGGIREELERESSEREGEDE